METEETTAAVGSTTDVEILDEKTNQNESRVTDDKVQVDILFTTTDGPNSSGEKPVAFSSHLKSPFYSLLNITTLISVAIFVFDLGTDIALAINYYITGRILYFVLTLTLIIVPALITNALSFYWIDKTTDRYYKIVSHLLLMAFVFRAVEMMRYKREYAKVKEDNVESSDIINKANSLAASTSLLLLLEAFTESAPQLLLQYYIFRSSTDKIQIFSFTISLIALSWAVTNYSIKSRNCQVGRTDRGKFSLTLAFIFRLYSIAVRMLIFTRTFLHYKYWGIIPLCVRWVVMTSWLLYMKNPLPDYCYRGVLEICFGFVYVFVLINVAVISVVLTSDSVSDYELDLYRSGVWIRLFIYYMYDAVETTVILVVGHQILLTNPVDFYFILVYTIMLWIMAPFGVCFMCYLKEVRRKIAQTMQERSEQ